LDTSPTTGTLPTPSTSRRSSEARPPKPSASNFAKLLEGAPQAPNRPDNIWVGDETARAALEQLTRDAGLQPRHGGPLDRAATQEAFAALFVAIVKDADSGLLYYRFATPETI
jgi:predicted dinucleotide-binding enzyme